MKKGENMLRRPERLRMTSLKNTVSLPCKTCQSWLGLTRFHDECPVRASAWCSQCGCYGHRPSECGEEIMWTRPASLEELIPSDVRGRWGIQTQTKIEWSLPTLDDSEREIAEINTIEIRYQEDQGKGNRLDGRLREFMKLNKIHTTHKMEDNIKTLRSWAIQQGKKIRLVQGK